MLENKVRFLLAVINGKLVVSNRSKADILKDLIKLGLKTFESTDSSSTDHMDVDTHSGSSLSAPSLNALEKGYDYLLGMKIWNLTKEKVKELTDQRDQKKIELDLLLKKTREDLWLEDLVKLEYSLNDFEASLEEANKEALKAIKASKSTQKKRSTPKKRKLDQSPDSGIVFIEDSPPVKKKIKTTSSNISAKSSSVVIKSVSSVPAVTAKQKNADVIVIDEESDDYIDEDDEDDEDYIDS